VSDFKPIPNAGPAQPLACEQCETLLADALDGVLSAADQATFDRHIRECAACSAMMSDAQRGGAWLEMLRFPRPEPSTELLDRILAQTSGSTSTATEIPRPIPATVPSSVPTRPATATILPFRTRIASSFTHILREPRLAMTAAMAFFSVALTLSMTRVQLKDIRFSQLSPSSLERTFFSANAAVVRYYDNLSVVAELQSRVRGLQSDSNSDADITPQLPTTPAPQPNATPVEPKNDQHNQHDQQSAPKQPSPGAGTSHRQLPNTDSTRSKLVSPTRREPEGTTTLSVLLPNELHPALQDFSQQHKDQA
jgi:hypothetical protein